MRVCDQHHHPRRRRVNLSFRESDWLDEGARVGFGARQNSVSVIPWRVTFRKQTLVISRERRSGWTVWRKRSAAAALFVATEAIREYVKVNEWQIEETRKALAEADREEVSPSEVRNVVKKWTSPRRSARAR